ncbi:hypothetical protein GIB67_021132 [Kingdonia uniflora]|uniref:Aminotransferase-like plant mobile domain-containing protein n=1 Tax=Kingdonia uniflora TaxID=39325 RepID=A0A7J7N7C6_9MAGN|nr:hypothetical protein GIB67_021132 [Kingdonia uniflora]
MNEKVPPTASNRRKRELAREGDLVTYKRKRNTIDQSTVVPPNTVDSANEGVIKPLPPVESTQASLGAQAESAQAVNIPQGEASHSRSPSPIYVGPYKGTTSGPRFCKVEGFGYNYYNSALIYAFAERWQPETNSFHFKWGEMTPTLDDVEQLVGLPADGDATVIGGTSGIPAILESLKAGGTGNSLSLRKLKEHYAYKLEKALSDGTAAAAKTKKGLITRSVTRAYMMYVLGSFLFPTKKGTDVSARNLYLLAKDKVAKKWSWGLTVLAHIYYNLGAASRDDGRQFACCTMLLESWIFAHFPKLAGISKEMDSDAYEHCTCWKWDVSVTDRYGGTTLLKFREALDNYKPEDVVWDPYRDKRDSAHAFKEWKEFVLKKTDRGQRVREGPLVCTEEYLEWFASVSWTTISPITVDPTTDDDVRIHQRMEASVNEHGDIPVHQFEDIAEQYDASTSECDLLKETIEKIKEEIELKRVVDEQCALEFADLPRQLDAKCKESESLKVVNALLMEQIDLQLFPATPEVWRQALKKALASEGMGDTGDPTFEELFEQNERFFTIAQQGPKGDYYEDLVSTAVTLENVVIARREKMAKKMKIQELLFQPWTKYLVDVRGVEISANNSCFRVTAAIQYQSHHRFPDLMKSLKTFICKDPAFWKNIFSQTLGI